MMNLSEKIRVLAPLPPDIASFGVYSGIVDASGFRSAVLSTVFANVLAQPIAAHTCTITAQHAAPAEIIPFCDPLAPVPFDFYGIRTAAGPTELAYKFTPAVGGPHPNCAPVRVEFFVEKTCNALRTDYLIVSIKDDAGAPAGAPGSNIISPVRIPYWQIPDGRVKVTVVFPAGPKTSDMIAGNTYWLHIGGSWAASDSTHIKLGMTAVVAAPQQYTYENTGAWNQLTQNLWVRVYVAEFSDVPGVDPVVATQDSELWGVNLMAELAPINIDVLAGKPLLRTYLTATGGIWVPVSLVILGDPISEPHGQDMRSVWAPYYPVMMERV